MKNGHQSRRNFLHTGLAGLAGSAMCRSIVPDTVFGAKAPSNRIYVGAIGTGRISREHDMPETLKYSNTELVAVCDVDSKRAREGKE